MWTVSHNGTPDVGRRLRVAFFNGAVDDESVIGVDRDGRDWSTGSASGQRFGARERPPRPGQSRDVGSGKRALGADRRPGPSAPPLVGRPPGPATAGDVLGDDSHDGFLRFREEMLAVDSTIKVGAVGIGGDQGEWSGFGEKVIETAAGRAAEGAPGDAD